jgi:hypothetical protein
MYLLLNFVLFCTNFTTAELLSVWLEVFERAVLSAVTVIYCQSRVIYLTQLSSTDNLEQGAQ